MNTSFHCSLYKIIQDLQLSFVHELDLTKGKAHNFLLFNYTLSQDLNHHAYLLANPLISFEFLSWLTTPGLRKYIRSHMYLYWHQHPHVRWTVSLVIADGHLILLRYLCRLVQVNNLSPAHKKAFLITHRLNSFNLGIFIYLFIYLMYKKAAKIECGCFVHITSNLTPDN